jgi:hypothetical protein
MRATCHTNFSRLVLIAETKFVRPMLYSRTSLIRINWDGEPSWYAENSDFSFQTGYIGSLKFGCYYLQYVEPNWNVMAHSDARVGKWRGNWRMEWVASTLHTTSEYGVSSTTNADAHTSAASSRLNRRPRRFKRTRPLRRKTKSGFCARAITFQTQSTCIWTFRPSSGSRNTVELLNLTR